MKYLLHLLDLMAAHLVGTSDISDVNPQDIGDIFL